MNRLSRIIALPVLAACVVSGCCGQADAPAEALLSKQEDFANLINIKNVPEQSRYWDAFVFRDLGAWSAYALPENESNRLAGAFIGPMVMTGRGWVAQTLAQPMLRVDGTDYNMVRNVQTTKYLPGRLVQEYNDEQLNFVTELCYATDRSAVVRSVVTNVSSSPVTVDFTWTGKPFEGDYRYSTEGTSVEILRQSDSTCTVTRFITADNARIASGEVAVTEKAGLVLEPGQSYQAEYSQSVLLRGEDVPAEIERVSAVNVDECFSQNKVRWDAAIASLLDRAYGKFRCDNKYRRVLVKAMITLNSNWCSPAGDILTAGSNPSYVGFIDGIWSWDSWKIASANVFYNPEMAKDEMRTLFDYQADNGMVPDFISYNKAHNNWRDSKPPVAAWGTMNVYRETGDKEFLAQMYGPLMKFHNWWFAERDHDRNGICEYGSTDGTLIAACWESGMDNGVRFDGAQMLRNGGNAWSMNQENICLNSFLYKEKLLLAEMADILGKTDDAKQLREGAEVIKNFVQTKMYDEETGFFYDTRIGTGEFIKVMGAECWLPLWAGIATKEQAAAVKEKMMDPEKFNSTLPLGTLDISHPRLRPVRGYWRGPVWVDQVYFGITGLRNYGYDREADYLVEKFINNAQGLTTDGPIHENYNPLTGEALNSPNFGWSSAVIIKMLLNN
ncbi:MAG: MGH1-like glycoside hydrolase domain-containing protein [Candidatus Cryptobacteroides sp.]